MESSGLKLLKGGRESGAVQLQVKPARLGLWLPGFWEPAPHQGGTGLELGSSCCRWLFQLHDADLRDDRGCQARPAPSLAPSSQNRPGEEDVAGERQVRDERQSRAQVHRDDKGPRLRGHHGRLPG